MVLGTHVRFHMIFGYFVIAMSVKNTSCNDKLSERMGIQISTQ